MAASVVFYIYREGNVMRFTMWGLIIGFMLLSAIGRVGAQEEGNPMEMSLKYSEGWLLNHYMGGLYNYLIKYDICVEDFIAANLYIVHDYYKHLTPNQFPDELWNLGPTTPYWYYRSSNASPIYIPEHKPCYQSYHATVESWVQLEK